MPATTTPAQDAALIAELNALLRMTRSETTLATARRAQARTPELRRDVEQNLKDSRERSRLLIAAIRELGGVPDVVGVATGHAFALAKTQIEQVQDLPDAMFDELSLIQQLHARARYTKVLAEAGGHRDVVRLAERLERSHQQTIDWLETHLAELAVGGPPAIRPTPVQAVSGAARKVASLPARSLTSGLNRTVASARRLRRSAEETLSEQLRRAVELGSAAREVATAGRNAALGRAEEIARAEGAGDTVRTLHTTRSVLGALEADELPIEGYDDLSAGDAATRVRELTEAEDVHAVLAYEQANRARVSVTRAAEQRLEEVARGALGDDDGEETTSQASGRDRASTGSRTTKRTATTSRRRSSTTKPSRSTGKATSSSSTASNGRRSGNGSRATRVNSLADLTVEQLRERAATADIDGRSSMSKDELVDALRSR